MKSLILISLILLGLTQGAGAAVVSIAIWAVLAYGQRTASAARCSSEGVS